MPAEPSLTELAHRILGDRDLSAGVTLTLPLHTLIDLYRCLAWLVDALSDAGAHSPRHAYLGEACQRIAARLHAEGIVVSQIPNLPQTPE